MQGVQFDTKEVVWLLGVGARNVLSGSQFAVGVQAFQSLQGLQEGVVRLG